LKLDLSNHLDQNKACTYFERLLREGKKIELKEFAPARTSLQNRYFHAICTILGNDLGYTVDEMKIVIKRHLEWMQYKVNGQTFLRSSSSLDTIEFTDLIDFTRSTGQDNGCYLPTPDEYYQNTFEIEKLIK
jgi:hypothetical protein